MPPAPGSNTAPRQAQSRGRNERTAPSLPPLVLPDGPGLPSRPSAGSSSRAISSRPATGSSSRAGSSSAHRSSYVLPPLRFSDAMPPPAMPALALSSSAMPAPLRFSMDTAGLVPVLPAPPQPRTLPSRPPQPGSSQQHEPTPSSTSARPIKPLPSRTSSSVSSSAPKPARAPTPPPPFSFTTKDHLPLGYTAASLWGDTAIVCYDTGYIGPSPRHREPTGEVGMDGYTMEFEVSLYAQPYDKRAPFMGFTELPLACNREWLEFRDPSRADLSNRVAESDFQLSEAVKDDMHNLSWHLRRKYVEAEALLRLILREGALPKRCIERTIAEETNPPEKDSMRMLGCWLVLKELTLKSMADFTLVMRAWQRYTRITSAFLNFVGALVESVGRERFTALFPSEIEKAEYFVQRRKRRNLESQRRGVIFVGDDATKYQRFFRELRVPTYVRVTVDALNENAGIPLSATGTPRCSSERSESMTNVKQRDLPLAMYPPQSGAWNLQELLWRGVLPRDDSYQSSERRTAQFRRYENWEQDMKKHRVALVAKDAARRERFDVTKSDMGTSFEVYDWINQHAPTARRYLELRGTARPADMPKLLPDYAAADEEILHHLHYMPANGPHLATYLPPVHLFFGMKDEHRLATCLANMAWLMPILISRIAMARRPGSKIERFRVKDWRDILWGKGWTKEGFWEGGGKLFFGGSLEELAAAEGDVENPTKYGELPCGHEATVENIQGDRRLEHDMLVLLGQWQVLLFLPSLANPALLERAGVKGMVEVFKPTLENNHERRAPDPIVHHTPDFRIKHDIPEASREERNRQGKLILARIRDIVIADDGNVHPSGWTNEHSVEEIGSDTKRRVFLENFAQVLASSPHARWLDEQKGGTKGWWSTDRLKAYNGFQQVRGGRDTEDELQKHLFLRYVLTSLKTGHIPPEFFSIGSSYRFGYCAKECFKPVVVPAGMEYTDLLDEGESDDDYEGYTNEEW
ncbi:hypothetical protein PENSPDRAFT_681813 [Peniophora sp. CONT]|nr:hypothetical protein PENSPDRAFT_681813 [Peniophora sp. CONT]